MGMQLAMKRAFGDRCPQEQKANLRKTSLSGANDPCWAQMNGSGPPDATVRLYVGHHGGLPMQGLDVLEPLQQRRQLLFDRLLNHLPGSVPDQFVQPQTGSR